jgi:hypothetical protein
MFLLDVIKDYWVLFVLGIVVLFLVRLVFRTLFKVAMVLVLLGFVAVFVFNKPVTDVIDTGKVVTDAVDKTLQATVLPLIKKELDSATYKFNPDGTYEVRMSDIRITGKKGDPTATVHYGDHSFQMNISDLDQTLQKTIQDAQK